MAMIRGTNQADVIAPDLVSPGVQGGPPTPEADDIQAGNGADTVRAGGGNDTVLSENGDDQLWGEAGWDWLDGGNGNDQVHGGSEGDGLAGGRGDDRLWGDGGDDQLWGGPGTDEAVYAGARSDYAVTPGCDGTLTVRDLNGGADGLDEGTDTLHAVERLRFLGGTGPFLMRASSSAAGEEGNGQSFHPSLSADGSKLAFASDASNLVPGDTNAAADIFIKDLTTGAIARVYTAAEGEPVDTASYTLSLSADGSKLAFTSAASNLVPGDTNGAAGIFVKDLITGGITRASTSAEGEPGSAASSHPALSADGTKVAFESLAGNLVPGDTNAASDVFIKDLASGEITLVSAAATGEQGNSNSYSPFFSADGRFLAFESYATNLLEGGNAGGGQIFVKDLTTGEVTLASSAADGEPGNSFSAVPTLSFDGRFAAFESMASNLVPGDTNDAFDIFVKDLASGAVIRASTSTTGEQSYGEISSSSLIPWLSADGGRVAFYSLATNLVPGDANRPLQAFVKDLTSGVLTLVSAADNGEQGDGFNGNPGLSADGSTVAFESSSTNLLPGSTNVLFDILVREPGNSGYPALYAIGADGILVPLDVADDLWR